VAGRRAGAGYARRLSSSPLLEEARHLLRERVTHYTEDRFFAPDIENAIALLAARHLTRLLPAVL
jgi:histidine ammonia-lyase